MTGQALPDDRYQLINGAADNLVINQKSGLATYTGSVTIQQGSLKITADKIVIHTLADGSTDKIIATGTPARFEQQPQADQSVIKANASSITYTPKDERLLLIENASISQNGDTMKGPQIDYDLAGEVMKAMGGANSGSRVEFVIAPRNNDKDKNAEKDKKN